MTKKLTGNQEQCKQLYYDALNNLDNARRNVERAYDDTYEAKEGFLASLLYRLYAVIRVVKGEYTSNSVCVHNPETDKLYPVASLDYIENDIYLWPEEKAIEKKSSSIEQQTKAAELLQDFHKKRAELDEAKRAWLVSKAALLKEAGLHVYNMDISSECKPFVDCCGSFFIDSDWEVEITDKGYIILRDSISHREPLYLYFNEKDIGNR